MSPLVVDNVTKRFGLGERFVTALTSISLEVQQGVFLAIMGASGSGKSTLLHLMAGLTLPDSGEVRVNGSDLGRMSDKQLTVFRRRHIGLVFQSFNLIPTLSAMENVELPLMLDGGVTPEISDKLIKLMDSLGLAQRGGHGTASFTGGE